MKTTIRAKSQLATGSRRPSVDPPATLDLDPAKAKPFDASTILNDAVTHPIIKSDNLIDVNYAGGRSRSAVDELMKSPNFEALRSKYLPKTNNRSPKEQSLEQKQQELSLLSDKGGSTITTVSATTIEAVNAANIVSYSSGVSGTFSIPFLKEGRENFSLVPTKISGSSDRRGSAGVGNSHEKNRNSDGRGIRRRSSVTTTRLSSAIDSDDDDDDDDNWMEEALLHGISKANKKEGVEYQRGTQKKACDDHLLTTPASEKDQKGKFIKSQVHSALSAPFPSTQNQLQQQSRLSSRQSSDDIRFSFPDMTIEDLSSNSQTINGARRTNERKKEYPTEESQSSSHHTSYSTSHHRQHGERMRQQAEIINSNSTPMLSPELSLLSSTTKHPHSSDNDFSDARLFPSFSNKNFPTLPIIKTYRLTKNRPDEPVGLFLTKSKNGAVLVHSLSPESPFLRLSSNPLSPGQEILSVNEKRINDPKMAARIITHAKKHLSLRVSTVKRGRGFMYCQVKRKNNGCDAEEIMGDGVVAAASTGTNTMSETDGRATVVLQPFSGMMGVGKRMGTVNSVRPFHPGVRFVTTSVDGVRRGMATEGLVRVSHIDPDGLFASSSHMNLRVGGIVLTVNGTPVTNGKAALDAVMGSRQLIEILHCDERFWRDAWVKDGLKHVLSEAKMEQGGGDAKIDTSNNSADGDNDKQLSDSKSSVVWDLEWLASSEEVILRKKRIEVGNDNVSDTPNYAFRLVFKNDVGTCHSDLVDDLTMMPPTEELNVSLLVQIVNRTQRNKMSVLQNMLRKAHSELFGDSELVPDRSLQYSAAITGAPRLASLLAPSRKWPNARSDVAASDNLDSRHQNIGNIRRGILKKQELNESKDVMSKLVKDDNGGFDKELFNDLFSVDSRDRKRSDRHKLQAKQLISLENASRTRAPRRGSETFSNAMAPPSLANIEQWRAEQWKNQHTTSKIRDFSARQHKIDQIFPSGSTNSRLSGFSFFSADIYESSMEDFMCDGESTNSVSSREEADTVSTREALDTPCTTYAPSPRNDALNLSPSQESGENDFKHKPHPIEKKVVEEEKAFITGVFRDVSSKYEISDTIVGSGGFGEVRECYNKTTGKIYVVKSILKPDRTNISKVNLIRNEILLLHEAHHPNIVELQDLFEDDKYVHIVMERCTGGDLFDRVVSENPRQLRSHAEAVKYETQIAHVMRSILHVLKYLHSKSIVHRDIKPEHFLLTTDERKTQKIKLIDFGLARKHKPGTAPMTTFTGSPSFVAPEVIARKYDHMCDMFSTGVTAYFLLTGMLPFNGPTDEVTFDLISEGTFEFPSSLFLSDDAKDFISKLLVVDSKMRLSADKALNHPWLLKAASC